MFSILSINPGSTSTKIACFNDEELIFEKNIPLSDKERASFPSVLDQLDRRFELISEALGAAGFTDGRFDAVVGRGGLIAPVPSGTYVVGDSMVSYLKKAPRGEHASNLGALLARKFARLSGCPAYIVDPVSVDELSDVARISGAPEMERTSLVHALNHKAVARKVAAKLGKKYEDCRFVVAHLGTGVTLGVHCNGRIIDVSGAKAEGPFSPERAGGLPVEGVIDLCFSGRYTEDELKKKLLSGWGFVAYLGTRDLREIFKMAETDKKAEIVLEAFVYQVAKGIGEFCTVLDGDIDAIIITGGMAHSERLMEMLLKKIKFLAPIEIVPGEDELAALAMGALRVLKGEERPRSYPDGKYV
ncbi:MAG: butyrate kinase [Synergistaceae bacterium]|nr:butyrate kinase [Synergistaceae bacterium]